MLRYLICLVSVLILNANLWAGPPRDELVQKLRATIKRHCPEAEFEVTEHAFIAKAGTMTFTMHSRSKTGEVYPQTYQKEGPNFKGFLLQVSLQPGRYEGAAVIPQTLNGPYYQTYIDAVATEQRDQYHWVNLDYGSRLDPNLKKALFEAIPRTKFATQEATPVSEPRP